MERETVRCPACELNQFKTENGLCRRCHSKLNPNFDPLQHTIEFSEYHRRQANLPAAIGFIVKASRLIHNQSQRQLALRIGWHRIYICRIEHGVLLPNLPQLMRLSKGLGMTTGTLVNLAQLAQQALQETA